MTGTRQAKKPSSRRTVWLDWSETFAWMFGPVVEGWTPPAQVRGVIGRTPAGTWTARFTDSKGEPVEAFVRIRARGDDIEIVESGLRKSFTFQLGAAK